MKEIWKQCEDMMETLAKEKQSQIERIIEEVTTEKFEKLAEAKASFDIVIKRMETAKQKEKADAKRKEKEAECKVIQDEMEQIKKDRIEALNKEFEERKRQVMLINKDKQIQEASQKLATQSSFNVNKSTGSRGKHSREEDQRVDDQFMISPIMLPEESKLMLEQDDVTISVDMMLVSTPIV